MENDKTGYDTTPVIVLETGAQVKITEMTGAELKQGITRYPVQHFYRVFLEHVQLLFAMRGGSDSDRVADRVKLTAGTVIPALRGESFDL
jgi:hypothetical protein